MSKKQTIFVVVFAVVILAGVVIGVLTKREPAPPSSSPGAGGALPGTSGYKNPAAEFYSSEVPKSATVSVPKNEAPASANPSLDTKIKSFDLQATRSGFIPSSFTVKSGDNLQISFTAVDGDYDLSIPYLGASFNTVKKGATKILPFDTSLPGTFTFTCSASCPSSGKITGQLIVLPRK